jgi:hypothetical protein
MAEFKLDRFKYRWRGDWETDVSYRRDDIVRINGRSYVCLIGHVSSAIFRTDLDAILPGSVPPQPQPKWVVMTRGFSFVGDWTNGIEYNLGDIVKIGGTLWICSVNHLSTTFSQDVDYWTAFSSTVSISDWESNTSYAPGQILKYNGMIYKCVTAHTSEDTLQPIPDGSTVYWEEYFEGVFWKDEFVNGQEYRVNDVVKYGGSIYRCITTHTASNFIDENFEIIAFGSQYESFWTSGQIYNIGDIVRHEGFVYYSITNNSGSRPYVGSNDWILLSRSINFLGSWNINNSYKSGDVVLRGGNLYLALKDVSSEANYDGSTLDYLDNDTWELLVPGKTWKGNWRISSYYSVGDIVYYKGTAYTCNIDHESSIINYPGDNGSGYYFWDVLIQAGQPAALQDKGDLLTYGLNREIDNDGSTVFDDSTLGDKRVPIGESEQLLSVTEDLELYWRDIAEDADTVYVATNGVDDVNRGSFQKPFRTIRYAAEYVEDNYTPGSPVIIRVSTGKYKEIAPIIVPAGCAINGDELRSTTVIVNSALPEYQNNYPYLLEYMDRFFNIVAQVIRGIEITPTVGNLEPQVTEVLEQAVGQFGDPLFDAEGTPIFNNIFPVSDLTTANAMILNFKDFEDFYEFNIEDGSVNPTVTGSNVLSSEIAANAWDALVLNKKFLQEEIYSFITNEYPDITFDKVQIINDFWSIVRGLARDVKYSGNYGLLIAARRYVNAVRGSQTDNLFLMRDSTGLRDMTTGGLEGVLNPPGVFELYQKPTGGALISFDSGWGPEDTRTWITNRSPYIQGVTNTGFGCVGIKMDGNLHQGGNKSMVANDFTQVLSDGIGVWVTNNARAELVSIFTYYCQIGYFAEDGGVIRAANGNNSYGKYGSVADGIDSEEIPQIVSVDNRKNQAYVSEAFAGGATDQIKIFEYGNAGQNYTTADAEISGAGANANVEFTDFRDGGIFEVRLISPDGSSSEGGQNYTRKQGNAQETLDASSTLKLAATDTTQFESEILGLRIFITGGTGVGQYGYITAFNFSTKEITVTRESDEELGWDHIIPGTANVSAFDLTTRYRIEPRITLPSPQFNSSIEDLFTNRTYVDMAFGGITQQYNGVSGSGNVIWRDDNNIRVLVRELISETAIQFTGALAVLPETPLNIRGRISGATATVLSFSANTGEILEADFTEESVGTFSVGEEIDLIFESGTGDTFDAVAIPAEFNVLRKGSEYDVSIASGGSGYKVNDKITISGEALGGSTPENDLTLTVTEVTDDSTSSVVSFTQAGLGRGGRFISLTSDENARWSDDGVLWTEVQIPLSTYTRLVAGDNKFLALSRGSNQLLTTLTGLTYTPSVLPTVANWNDGVYGNGKFVLVNTDSDTVASSSNGSTWTTSTIPDDTDGGADSTTSVWSYITYGAGKFVAVSTSDLATATSTDGVNWTRHDSVTPEFIGETIVAVEYGNNRFVIVTDQGSTAFSFDGITWTEGETITPLSGTTFNAVDLKYSQGIFLAIGLEDSVATNLIATSEYGVLWNTRTLAGSNTWGALTYGNSQWVIKANASTTDALAIVSVGANAFVRAEVDTGSISEIRVINPGSNYDSSNPPMVTVVDPEATFDVATEARIGNRVLAQPDFINRGAGYRSSSSTITIAGDGFADIYPIENTLTVSGITVLPGPGVQIEIDGLFDPDALQPNTPYVFSGVTVTDLGDDGTGNETRSVRFQISPRLEVQYVVEHGTEVTLRERFSQCRISGHDFLDIGTGNFEQTNYPAIYASGNYFVAAPENEVLEQNGGRVFYVSTDQDGNFRTGELFSVQQATGIVTISAEFFDLDGLSELALGGVRLGGSGAVVNEFSTDPTFSADSNNVVPTQRAIAIFLADRLSVGGESLEVNRLQAGRVILGGVANEINIVSGNLNIDANVIINGTYESDDGAGNVTINQTAISGTIVSQMLMFKGFDESMQ